MVGLSVLCYFSASYDSRSFYRYTAALTETDGNSVMRDSRTFMTPGALTVETRWHLKRRRKKQTTRRLREADDNRKAKQQTTHWLRPAQNGTTASLNWMLSGLKRNKGLEEINARLSSVLCRTSIARFLVLFLFLFFSLAGSWVQIFFFFFCGARVVFPSGLALLISGFFEKLYYIIMSFFFLLGREGGRFSLMFWGFKKCTGKIGIIFHWHYNGCNITCQPTRTSRMLGLLDFSPVIQIIHPDRFPCNSNRSPSSDSWGWG